MARIDYSNNDKNSNVENEVAKKLVEKAIKLYQQVAADARSEQALRDQAYSNDTILYHAEYEPMTFAYNYRDNIVYRHSVNDLLNSNFTPFITKHIFIESIKRHRENLAFIRLLEESGFDLSLVDLNEKGR